MRTGLNGGFALADIEPSRSDAVLPDDREGPSATIELSRPGVVVTASDEWPGCVVCKPGLSSAAPQSFGLASRASDDDILLPFAASPDGVALLDPSGLILATNPRAGRMGGAPHAAGPASWLEIWDAPDDRGEAEAALTRARAGHPARFRAAAGPVLWDVTVTPVAGSPPRLLTVARDISEQRQAEARQGVLLMEMEHRLKNTLSIVQAIATQTLRNASSLSVAAESFGARMLALAQAHDVLMQGAWASASLHGLVDGAVRLHGDGMPERFRVTGPEIMVGPRAALTLALMLHELGTNAAKYGALSNAEGRVEIGWRIVGEAAQERLWFRWAERGGPPVAPPTRSGFGSRLIERSLVHSFGGSARLRYPRGGVVLALTAPLAAVAAEGGMG